VADVDRYDESADAVVLMTIHSAKGLEFPVAIIPGLEEGIFPGSQSLIDPSELEEERRLAYVALTRAQKELYLYYTNCRLLYGRTMRNPVSRFVEDIPSELLNRKEKPQRGGAAGEYSPWGSYSAQHPRVYISSAGGTGAGDKAPKADVLTINRPQAPKKMASSFAPGDRVRHPTFGVGEVLSVKAMGSDKLYEIIFDTVGTKKLMATYAKLTKID
jgi:DNA helicase-2/ATP-dependent DNA helicase PcrA